MRTGPDEPTATLDVNTHLIWNKGRYRVMIIVYMNGPRSGEREFYPGIPTKEIKVYADPPDGMLCADEQVIHLLGKYRRFSSENGSYLYEWMDE